MRKSIILAALSATILAGAFVAQAAPPATYADLHLARILEGTGGHLPEVVVRTTYEADALGNVARVEREIPFEDHLEAVSRISAPGVETALATPDGDVGIGSNTLLPDENFFCDSFSVFVDQFGRGSEPAESLAKVVVDPLDASAVGEEMCGGFYGGTMLYADVTFDLRDADPAYSVQGGASAQQWLLGDEDDSDRSGWTVASVHGTGVLFADQFCFFGFCDTFDYFLGNDGVVLLGSDGVTP